jgi:aspartyl-tRNA(Asn)/glutamyl-tRNA(Gln) amidotransferase subunit A
LPSSGMTCVARWEACRARYEAIDPRVRSVITWIDASLEAAAEADRLAALGERRGALHGLIIGLKDNIDTAGVQTTAGAAFLAGAVAERNAACVDLLESAGAVVVAKLNMAELAWGATTQNLTYGACRNPWDTDRIPGGSSGGSGAALAARIVEAALGTDTGASVRIPSSVNGIVGLRPTYGAISIRGVYPASHTQDTVGPMAVLATDVARMTETLTVYDVRDPYSRRGAGAPATSLIGKPLDGMVVGIPDAFFYDDLDAGIAQLIDDFRSWIALRGLRQVSVADFDQANAFEHWTRIVQVEGAAFHEERIKASPGDFSPDVLGRISAGLDVRAVDLARSLDWRVRYRHQLETVLADIDVIATPVIPIDVPPAEGYDSRATTRALGRITYPWGLHAGPTMTLPIGFHPDSGLPVGVALSAASWAEAKLFQVAAAYQQDTDWHKRVPPMVLEWECGRE